MTKKKSNTSEKQLQVTGISIQRPPASAASRGGPPQMDLFVEIENTGDQALYVWTSRRKYAYNASTHVLSVHLAEPEESLPPYIKMLSDHVSTPSQAVVDAKSRITIEVRVPATIARFTPGQGLGRTFAEDPIGQIDRVEIHVQFAAMPIQYRIGEPPADFRKRLRAHGDVVTAEVTPTIEKEK